MAQRALVTGATGFVGGRLALSLSERGWDVRCLVRDRSRAVTLADAGMELVEGDLLDAAAIHGAGRDVDVAYYLVHAMGRGGGGDFEEREARAARNFAEMAAREGVKRVIYLGGLGDRPASKHLKSRHRTAEILAELGPDLTYFRAGMVVGAASESFRTLRYLVQRLPVMIAPAWLATPTQAIAIEDVISYLAAAPEVERSTGREVQIGGPDVLSYGDMLDRMAEALGLRPRRRIPVPLLTPWLSSHWIGLVTPVDAGVARPLVEGLSTSTTVTDPSGAALFDIEPVPLSEALSRALAEEDDTPAAAPAVRLLPAQGSRSPRAGSVSSEQSGELETAPAGSGSEGIDAELLDQVGGAYWRYLDDTWFGLIRVSRQVDGRVRVGLAGVTLLRFGPPRRAMDERSGSITWPIEGGALVSRAEPDRGHLRLLIQTTADAEAGAKRRIVTMEVANYYPAIRGRGPLAGVRARLYANTQERIHRRVTSGFLRSLGSPTPSQ